MAKNRAEPRLAYTINEIDKLRAELSAIRQSRQRLVKAMNHAADEIGKRGLIDLADDLRIAAKFK
jgi:hypothetical protein